MSASIIGRMPRYISSYLAFLRRKARLSYRPFFLGIETSGICNLRCVMCPHGMEPQRKRGIMSFDMFKKVIDEARGFVFEADLFGGGEPLLNPRIGDFIRYARQSGIKTRLHTNATKLTKEMSIELLNSGLDFLSLSFDGLDKESYERQRVNAEYEVTLGNIMGFLAQKKALAVGPYTVIQAVECDVDAPLGRSKARNALLALFGGLPADEIKVIPRHNYGGKVDSNTKCRPTSYSPCTFPWYSLFVLWDGTIVPCCLDWWGDYSLGNVQSTSLNDAWRSDKLARLRAALSIGDVARISTCANCDRLWQRTHLGIPVRSIRAIRGLLRG